MPFNSELIEVGVALNAGFDWERIAKVIDYETSKVTSHVVVEVAHAQSVSGPAIASGGLRRNVKEVVYGDMDLPPCGDVFDAVHNEPSAIAGRAIQVPTMTPSDVKFRGTCFRHQSIVDDATLFNDASPLERADVVPVANDIATPSFVHDGSAPVRTSRSVKDVIYGDGLLTLRQPVQQQSQHAVHQEVAHVQQNIVHFKTCMRGFSDDTAAQQVCVSGQHAAHANSSWTAHWKSAIHQDF
jgi:hypothetical protein